MLTGSRTIARARSASGLAQRHRGVVVPLFAIGAVAVVAMAGLALDLGRVYLTKTRLQNSVDATAIEGARNRKLNVSLVGSETKALDLFDVNRTKIAGSSRADAAVEFGETETGPWDDAAGADTSWQYVKVTVTDLSVATFLINIVSGTTSALISASAIAGPQGAGGCGAIPIVLCQGDVTSLFENDEDCSNGQCYRLGPDPTITNGGGAPTGELRIKSSANIGSGNYGLAVIEDPGCSGANGVNCLRQGLAGGRKTCFDTEETIRTKPGNSPNAVNAGINTRFGDYAGSMGADEYPPDVLTDNVLQPNLGGYYDTYLPQTQTGPFNHAPNIRVADGGGVRKRRVALAPVVVCPTGMNGVEDLEIVGAACLYFSRRSVDGSGATDGVYIQLIGECTTEGGPSDDDTKGTRIVLYRSSVES